VIQQSEKPRAMNPGLSTESATNQNQLQDNSDTVTTEFELLDLASLTWSQYQIFTAGYISGLIEGKLARQKDFDQVAAALEEAKMDASYAWHLVSSLRAAFNRGGLRR
jgi:hypothetical protein